MDICYQDGTPIGRLTYKTIHTVFLEVQQEERRLPARLLTEDMSFHLLFLYWIQACIDYMWFAGHGKQPECQRAPDEEQLRVLAFFRAGAQEDACSGFLEQLRKKLTAPRYPNIGSPARAEAICGEINEKLADTAPFLRLRTAAVCLLTNCFPEEIFAEGEGWSDILGGAAAEAKFSENLLTAEDGMVFTLDFAVDFPSGAELFPRTLCNKSGQVCTVIVQQDGEPYPVKLPPYGILRAVFSDPACTKLVSLKGCMSCGDTKRAVIQHGTADGVRLLFASTRCRTPLEYPQTGVMLDACAAELGGAVVLGTSELYSTVDSSLYRQRKDGLPVRCYRSGHQWARLYAGGRLESNLRGGAEQQGVTAVVEDGERGLLVCGAAGITDYRFHRMKPSSPVEFGQKMLERFLQADGCEVLETQFMKVVIHASGNVEVK